MDNLKALRALGFPSRDSLDLSRSTRSIWLQTSSLANSSSDAWSGSVGQLYIHIGRVLSASGATRWWKKVWNSHIPLRSRFTSVWSSISMISSLFCRLEGPHDQLSRLFGLLLVNGRNGASAGFLM